MLREKMTGIDLKMPINSAHKTFSKYLKGLNNVYRTNRILATIGFSTQKTIRQMRPQISRQPSSKNLFLFRSISLYGFRSNNLPSKSSRHRNLSSSDEVKTLSLRHPGFSLTQYFGECKRQSRLEDIRGVRTVFNKQSTNSLRSRRVRCPVEQRGLCSGFNNRRFMSVTFSMGKIPQTQSRSQDTYSDGLKRLYTCFYPHHRRKSPRCKYTQRPDVRTRRHLYYGSRLPGLCSALHFYSKPFYIYYKNQKQF